MTTKNTKKKVSFSTDTIEPSNRKICYCEGCSSCLVLLGVCNKWCLKKCLQCKENRCDGCFEVCHTKNSFIT